MTDTLIIILIIILAWWSGLLPFLLVMLGGIIVGIASVILSLLERVGRLWRSKRLGPVRWWFLNVTGIENRRVEKIMRRRPGTAEQKAQYEALLRENRKRNIRRDA